MRRLVGSKDAGIRQQTEIGDRGYDEIRLGVSRLFFEPQLLDQIGSLQPDELHLDVGIALVELLYPEVRTIDPRCAVEQELALLPGLTFQHLLEIGRAPV